MLVLGRTVGSADRCRAQMEVFGLSAADSFTPRSKSARIQLRPHDLNNNRSLVPKLASMASNGVRSSQAISIIRERSSWLNDGLEFGKGIAR